MRHCCRKILPNISIRTELKNSTSPYMMVYCRETSSSGVCKHETAEKNQLMQVSSPKGCWEELLTATPTFSRSIGQWRHLRPVVTSGVSFFTTFSHSFSHSYKTDVFSIAKRHSVFLSLSLPLYLTASVAFLSFVIRASHHACGFVSLVDLDCLL